MGEVPRILTPRVAGLAQLVARHLAKVEVAGSNPVARSMSLAGRSQPALFIAAYLARWPSGKARACKALIPGSNPGLASKRSTGVPSGAPFLVALPWRRAAAPGSLAPGARRGWPRADPAAARLATPGFMLLLPPARLATLSASPAERGLSRPMPSGSSLPQVMTFTAGSNGQRMERAFTVRIAIPMRIKLHPFLKLFPDGLMQTADQTRLCGERPTARRLTKRVLTPSLVAVVGRLNATSASAFGMGGGAHLPAEIRDTIQVKPACTTPPL